MSTHGLIKNFKDKNVNKEILTLFQPNFYSHQLFLKFLQIFPQNSLSKPQTTLTPSHGPIHQKSFTTLAHSLMFKCCSTTRH